MAYFYLFLAIACEVTATTSLKASAQFTKPFPTIVVVVGYSASFYLLTLCLRTISVGVAYAVWAGLGIVLVALLGFLVYGQKLDAPAFVGIGLIVSGVVVLNTLSDSVVH
jgi:small multidrug resistance pump